MIFFFKLVEHNEISGHFLKLEFLCIYFSYQLSKIYKNIFAIKSTHSMKFKMSGAIHKLRIQDFEDF